MNSHTQKLERVVKSVQRSLKQGATVRIFHGHTNSTREYKRRKEGSIDLSDFTEILEFNPEELYVVAEANVTMGKLVDFCLSKGFIPKVVPEFPDITVGGAIQGGAGESSSFRFGLFHEICREFEIVFGNGSVVKVSSTHKPELYEIIPCTLGSLGIITSAKIELILAQPYVKTTYNRISDLENLSTEVRKYCNRNHDFVDGVMLDSTQGVIITGEITDSYELPLKTFSKPLDDWYGLHIKDAINQVGDGSTYVEYIPIRDYLFRYDRGSFWMGKYAFDLLHIPFNKLTRFLLDKIFHTSELYKYLQATNVSQMFLVQDISLPEENIYPFLKSAVTDFFIFPLWICPLKVSTTLFSPSSLDTKLVINIGIWGNKYTKYSQFVEDNKKLEELTRNHKGRKVLYAHCFYSEEEFNNLYPNADLEKLRKKHQSDKVFVKMYDKIKVDKEYKINLLSGILRTFFKV